LGKSGENKLKNKSYVRYIIVKNARKQDNVAKHEKQGILVQPTASYFM
jgi:hypothetical protein